MRAERLLRIVLLLQSRGRSTAGALARELEVSTRTIQRDMDALSGAGIPVYATRGGDGGWALVEEYRTGLTGLTTSEALAIVVGRPRGVLADLGLDDPGEAPILKLMAAIAPLARNRAEHALQRVHVDLAAWDAARQPDPLLPQLHQAVWDDRLIRITYATSGATLTLAPLGLVCKGSRWYLVALHGDHHRTYRVSRILEVTVTDETFERPADFDLATHWDVSSAAYVDGFPRSVLRLRLRGDAASRARWVQARSRTIGPPDAEGWCEAVLEVEDEDNALTVIRVLGDAVVVVAPEELRHRAVRAACAFVAANTATSDVQPPS